MQQGAATNGGGAVHSVSRRGGGSRARADNDRVSILAAADAIADASAAETIGAVPASAAVAVGAARQVPLRRSATGAVGADSNPAATPGSAANLNAAAVTPGSAANLNAAVVTPGSTAEDGTRPAMLLRAASSRGRGRKTCYVRCSEAVLILTYVFVLVVSPLMLWYLIEQVGKSRKAGAARGTHATRRGGIAGLARNRGSSLAPLL